MACFAGVCWIFIVFTLPETYAPRLTVQKAQRLRKETGDSRYYAATEKQTMSASARISGTFLRPFKIMFREPMLIAITIYMSVSTIHHSSAIISGC
jgi:steroid 5-alpha reductase family enzyme